MTAVVVTQSTPNVITNQAFAVVGSSKGFVIVGGQQGIEGKQGVSADGFTMVAPQDFGAQRLLALTNIGLTYADFTNLSHVGKVIGFTTHAVSAGFPVKIRSQGELTGLAGLTPSSPLFVGSNGLFTTAAPTSGFCQQVGVTTSLSTVLINLSQPFILG